MLLIIIIVNLKSRTTIRNKTNTFKFIENGNNCSRTIGIARIQNLCAVSLMSQIKVYKVFNFCTKGKRQVVVGGSIKNALQSESLSAAVKAFCSHGTI